MSVKKHLKQGKVYLFGNENGTSESLRDNIVKKPLQDYGSNLTSEVSYVSHPALLCACRSTH